MVDSLTNAINEMPRRTVTGRVDFYRTIHKGLRHSLFDVTLRASRLDASDGALVIALVEESRRVIGLLRDHHDYEDQAVFEELVDAHAPALTRLIRDEHRTLATRLDWLASRADEVAAAPAAARAAISHVYYLELASFTSATLAHLDFEERVVMPALVSACDDAELEAAEARALAGVTPETRASALASMLEAVTPAERAALVDEVRGS